jgi:hypothetical protein
MTDIYQRDVGDLKALNGLTPTVVATYLVMTGWTRMGERNAGTVWTRRRDGGARHLFQPEDPTSPGHALRVSEMLATLAADEGRSELAILINLCGAGQVADKPAEENEPAAGRSDWMEPEYGLRRADLALVLDLAACRVARDTFVLELERLDWPLSQAAELADLVAECELLAAESARAATQKAEERADGLG